ISSCQLSIVAWMKKDNSLVYANALSAPVPYYQCSLSNSTTLSETEPPPDFNISPNPFHDNIHIEGSFTPTLIWRYTIFDMAGKEVRSGRITQNQLNLSALNPGVFMITISNNEGFRKSKIISKL